MQINYLEDEQASREKIIITAMEMNNKGINQGTSGNISLRTNSGMLITPSSIPYEKMKPEDIVLLSLDGDHLSSAIKKSVAKPLKPSSEWQLHSEILKNRKEINAVIHCHSIHATAVACHERGLPSFHYMTAIGGNVDIPCTTYSTFGSLELAQKVVTALERRLACLLGHHGQIAIAETLERAMAISIEVETLSHIYLQSCQLGEPKHLGENEMKNILMKFKSMDYGNN